MVDDILYEGNSGKSQRNIVMHAVGILRRIIGQEPETRKV